MDPTVVGSPQFGVLWRKKLLGNYRGWTVSIYNVQYPISNISSFPQRGDELHQLPMSMFPSRRYRSGPIFGRERASQIGVVHNDAHVANINVSLLWMYVGTNIRTALGVYTVGWGEAVCVYCDADELDLQD